MKTLTATGKLKSENSNLDKIFFGRFGFTGYGFRV